MGIFSKLLGKKRDEEAVDPGERSVEEFMTLVRVYYQGVIAVNLGITNLNMLPDLALFKRMLKIPTQSNKPGLAEKSRVRKVMMQDYGIKEYFFKEIEDSVKKNCRNMQQIQPYFYKFQGFCTDLFNMLEGLMKWKFRFAMLIKKTLYAQTVKTVHQIMTKSEWKEISDQKAAWSIRKYAESLEYSEQWVADFVYNVVLLARDDARRDARKKK